jgi:hypothetical protein
VRGRLELARRVSPQPEDQPAPREAELMRQRGTPLAAGPAPTVGRLVHFFPFAGSAAFAATVVSVSTPDMVNLEVLTDGTNGLIDYRNLFTADECRAGRAWRPSVRRRDPGQIASGASWMWPARTPS